MSACRHAHNDSVKVNESLRKPGKSALITVRERLTNSKVGAGAGAKVRNRLGLVSISRNKQIRQRLG